MTSNLWQLDATDLARLIRLGQVSSREATLDVLARIGQVNPRLNAIVRRLDEEALKAADHADAARARGEALGLLHGVPVTTKINTDQKGQPTDNGVEAFRDLIAPEDAPSVASLRAAGAILVGRTNAPAFSMRIFSDNALHGRTVNPLDPSRSAGGSSGGAGVAVATGMGPISLGNDIGGSVRIPAFCNGVVGLRVSLGRIPFFNPMVRDARPMGAHLMSAMGPLTRTVRDARLALKVLARGDARDTRWVDAPLEGSVLARPLRVALVPEVPGGHTHPTQAAAVRRAGAHLAAAGYVVEEVLPPDIEQVVAVWHAIGSGDVFRTLAPHMERFGDADAVQSMRLWLELAPIPDPLQVLNAFALRDLLLFRWQSFFTQYPLVILPTLADLPPPIGEDLTLEGQGRVLSSLRPALVSAALGLAGLAVPVGSVGTLRTGVLIIPPRLREDLALEAGEVIEAAEGMVVPIA
jgi:amidase